VKTNYEICSIAFLAATLIAAAVTDVRSGKVLNVVTYPAIIAGVLLQWWLGGADGLVRSLCGFAAGFGPLAICWASGGVGGGDVKLMGAVGALTDWRFAVAAMFCGFAVAAGMAVVVMIRKRIVVRTLKRIWRALWLAVIPGVKAVSPSEADSPKIPFGVALCVGSAAVLADSLAGGALSAAILGG